MQRNWQQLHRRRMSRRSMLGAGAKVGVGAAGLALVGCGGDDDDGAAPASAPGPTGRSRDSEPFTDPITEAIERQKAIRQADLVTAKYCPSFEAPFTGILAMNYVAEALGYFEQEGLKEEWVYQTGCVPLLISGATDFAFLDVPETLNAFDAGRPVKAVFQPAYTLIFGVFVPQDSPILTWNADDLRGQTVGVTEFVGGEVPVVRALLSRIGLTEGEDVELLPTSGLPGQQPTIDAFNDGRIVAFGGGRHDVFGVELGGLPMRDITPPDMLEIRAAEAITVNADRLEDPERRDFVIRWLRAYAKGITFMNENVEAAAQIGFTVTGEDPDTLQEAVDLLNIFFFNRQDRGPGVRFGEVPVQGWVDFENLLLDGLTGAETDPLNFDEFIDVNVVIDNGLIDEINTFDAEAIKEQARTYSA